MTGIVIVSHCQKLAEGIVELARAVAPGAALAAAGGLEDGSLGTSYDKIKKAADEVCGDEGALFLMDMGSSVMTAEMVLEELKGQGKSIEMADCPLVEGAVVAAIGSGAGETMEQIKKSVEKAWEMRKL